MNIREYNRLAWDNEVRKGNEWTVPVSTEEVNNARKGKWYIKLTPTLPVPKEWFPDVKGLEVLCLASGGGQQGPILAAAGAKVTVLDNSPMQLERDGYVAKRDSLSIRMIEGDMTDVNMFNENTFDLIVHPVSNNFTRNILSVWKEAFRVLKRGGPLLSGFVNPAVWLFDYALAESKGIFQIKYKLPYSDEADLGEEELKRRTDNLEPIEFSHTLEEQIGGQTKAGFIITDLYEDRQSNNNDPIAAYMATCIATRAIKPI